MITSQTNATASRATHSLALQNHRRSLLSGASIASLILVAGLALSAPAYAQEAQGVGAAAPGPTAGPRLTA